MGLASTNPDGTDHTPQVRRQRQTGDTPHRLRRCRPKTQPDRNRPVLGQRWTMEGRAEFFPRPPISGPDTAPRSTLTQHQTHTDTHTLIPKDYEQTHCRTTSKAVPSHPDAQLPGICLRAGSAPVPEPRHQCPRTTPATQQPFSPAQGRALSFLGI